jgi:hypothetical protein
MPPAFIVHHLDHAVAALTAAAEADDAVTLVSPPAAVYSLGVGYFLAMIAAARDAVPKARATAILDCGDAAGLAVAALRGGADAVHLEASDEVLDRVADMARELGGELARHLPDATVDLGTAGDPAAAARLAFRPRLTPWPSPHPTDG